METDSGRLFNWSSTEHCLRERKERLGRGGERENRQSVSVSEKEKVAHPY
jgi:hypothetical protein